MTSRASFLDGRVLEVVATSLPQKRKFFLSLVYSKHGQFKYLKFSNFPKSIYSQNLPEMLNNFCSHRFFSEYYVSQCWETLETKRLLTVSRNADDPLKILEFGHRSD